MSRLAQEIRQSRPFLNREEEAFLNLLRTAGELSRSLGAVLEPLDLTPTQYNVLRILRGAHPGGLACGEIGERMVTPVPDVTRMLDRLAAQGLLERQRAEHDRRIVEVGITRRGRERLAALDEPIARWLAERMSRLGRDRLGRLIRALERLRREA